VHHQRGDGFGVGWYGEEDEPAVFRGIEPAWNGRNLRNLSKDIRSGLVFAHVRGFHTRAGSACELSPLSPRPLAVDAQRVDP
jgi:predicted glutamine amidotransferase